MKIKFFAGTLVLAILLTLLVGSVLAATPNNGQETCPDGDGWVKVDNLSGYDYTYTPPAGYHVTQNCYKHSTFVHFGSGPTVSADLHWNGLNWIRYELSHASFLLEQDEVQPTNTPIDTPPPPPTNTPTPTNTLDPNENSASVQPSVNCDGDWNLNLWASEGAVMTGETSGNLGTGSVHYNVEVTFSEGEPLSFHFEGDLNPEECGGEDNTPTPTATATREKPANPAGGFYVKKSTFGPASAFANIPGLHTIDGAPFDYTFSKYGGPEAMVEVWGVASFDLTSEDGLAIWVANIGYADGYDGIASYGPEEFSLGKKYGFVESDWQGQFVIREGTQAGNKPGLVCTITAVDWSRSYCGWIVNILPQNATPLPPPAEQPTPAPLQNTGAGGAGGLLAFGGLLVLLVVVIGGVSFGLGAKKR